MDYIKPGRYIVKVLQVVNPCYLHTNRLTYLKEDHFPCYNINFHSFFSSDFIVFYRYQY